jgi:hypothetical protein
MKSKKSKTEYLSYIEETSKHVSKIHNAASKATTEARKTALSNGIYVTYLRGNEIVKEYPSGRTITISTINDSSIRISKDGTFQVP